MIKIGDFVELYNGTKGNVLDINKSNMNLLVQAGYDMWFHIQNVEKVNGVLIDSDDLTF